MNEKWAEAIPGYAVSNQGRVKSHKSNKILAQQKSPRGLNYVFLYLDGFRRKYYTHILVVGYHGDRNGRTLGAGFPNLRSVGLAIKHIDGNLSNNNVENLEITKYVRRTKEQMSQ